MIDKEQALELLDRAVHQEGYGEDYVYTDHHEYCMYADSRDEPKCLVGHALHLAGVDISRLSHPTDLDGNIIDTDIFTLHEFKKVDLANEAAVVFDRAQRSQDSGETWGEALEAARDV